MQHDIGSGFLRQMVATAPGRQHILSISVEAEEGDEADLFGQLATFIDDDRLRRVVERHRDDEVRHAQLFRGCLQRLGLEQARIPDEVKIISQVAATTDATPRPIETADDVVAIYAMLLAIERRGVQQFPSFAAAFDDVDPETAAVYRRVARDERGHIRYCQEIGRHHAADEAEWQRMVGVAAAIEDEAFTQVGLANLQYCAAQGWVDLDALLASTPST